MIQCFAVQTGLNQLLLQLIELGIGKAKAHG
jgi:hypothetical protein